MVEIRNDRSVRLAVWRHAAREGLGLLVGCTLVMFTFHWLYAYITSLISTPAYLNLFDELPKGMRGLLGISISDAASPRGRLAIGYVDPTVVVISAVWALARGSDAVSGPLDRGTLEMVLAQPVGRLTVLSANAGVTILGAAAIALAAWLGTCAGIATVEVDYHDWFRKVRIPLRNLVDYRDFIPSALNLFSLTVLAAAFTTLISACDRYRWRTLGIAGGFYVVQVILKMAGLMADKLQWTFRLTFLGAYWPQVLAVAGDETWKLSLKYNGILLGLAVACYATAAVVFHRRDLPAPL